MPGAGGWAGWPRSLCIAVAIRPAACWPCAAAAGLDGAERLSSAGSASAASARSTTRAPPCLGAGILPRARAETVMWTVAVVVVASIVVHGITGAPLTRRLEGRG